MGGGDVRDGVLAYLCAGFGARTTVMPKRTNTDEDETIHADETRRRFEAKFRVNKKGCWAWQAYRDDDNYGQFKYDGRTEYAHRVSWRIYKGEIPPGYDVDHKCKFRSCVNPDHLEPVTHEENMKRQRNKPAWAGDVDEAGNPLVRVLQSTSPELVIEWADELLSTLPHRERTTLRVADTTDAPWREFANNPEMGKTDPDGMYYVALFLYVVSLGVNWKTAATHILHMNPLSLKFWNRNPDWKEDFAVAKQRCLVQRWDDVSETMLDSVERRAEHMEPKDMIRFLDVAQKRDLGIKQLTQKRTEQPTLGSGTRFIFNFLGSPEQANDVIEQVVSRTASHVIEVEALPAPRDEDVEAEEDEDD